MKNYIYRISSLILLFLILQNFIILKTFAWKYYDDYESSISWQKEKAHLHSFASFLQNHPETIGYIAYYTKKEEFLKQRKIKINRAIKFLTQKSQIEKDRIIIIYAGKKDYSTTILQPIHKNSEPPRF